MALGRAALGSRALANTEQFFVIDYVLASGVCYPFVNLIAPQFTQLSTIAHGIFPKPLGGAPFISPPITSLIGSSAPFYTSAIYSTEYEFTAQSQPFYTPTALYEGVELTGISAPFYSRVIPKLVISTIGSGFFNKPIAGHVLPHSDIVDIQGNSYPFNTTNELTYYLDLIANSYPFNTEIYLSSLIAFFTNSPLFTTTANLSIEFIAPALGKMALGSRPLGGYYDVLIRYSASSLNCKPVLSFGLLTSLKSITNLARLNWSNNFPITHNQTILSENIKYPTVAQKRLTSYSGIQSQINSRIKTDIGINSDCKKGFLWQSSILQSQNNKVKYGVGIPKQNEFRVNYNYGILKAANNKVLYDTGERQNNLFRITYLSNVVFTYHRRVRWESFTTPNTILLIRSKIRDGERTRSGVGIKTWVPWIPPEHIVAQSTTPWGLILPGNFSKRLFGFSIGKVERYYSVHNTASFTVNSVDIPVTSLSISAGIDAFTYSFSASIPTIDGISIGVGNTAIIELNSTLFYGIIESISQSYSFGSRSLSVSGRSLNCVLTAPWTTPIARYQNAFPYSAITIANNLVTNIICKRYSANPLSFTVQFHPNYANLQDNWTIPEGEFNFENKTAHDALNEIAQACGGVIKPSFNSNELTIIKKYPLAPWKWHLDDWGSAQKITLSPDSIVDVNTSFEESVDPNKTILAGILGEGLIYIGKITGTDGLECQGVSVNRLFTSAAVMREYAIKRIASEMSMYKRSINTFYAPPDIPLLWPGQLIEISGLFRGLITSMKLDAKNGDKLEIGQSIEMICKE